MMAIKIKWVVCCSWKVSYPRHKENDTLEHDLCMHIDLPAVRRNKVLIVINFASSLAITKRSHEEPHHPTYQAWAS